MEGKQAPVTAEEVGIYTKMLRTFVECWPDADSVPTGIAESADLLESLMADNQQLTERCNNLSDDAQTELLAAYAERDAALKALAIIANKQPSNGERRERGP